MDLSPEEHFEKGGTCHVLDHQWLKRTQSKTIARVFSSNPLPITAQPTNLSSKMGLSVEGEVSDGIRMPDLRYLVIMQPEKDRVGAALDFP